MRYFDILEKRALHFEENKICWSLNYLVGYDFEGNYCEINGYETFCDDCIQEQIDKLSKILDERGSKYVHDHYDCSRDEFEITEIGYMEENCPETDDFCLCDSCGKLIHTSVLYTTDEEHCYYLQPEVSLKLNDLSDCDCYRIYNLITAADSISKYPRQVKLLKQKLNKQNRKPIYLTNNHLKTYYYEKVTRNCVDRPDCGLH